MEVCEKDLRVWGEGREDGLIMRKEWWCIYTTYKEGREDWAERKWEKREVREKRVNQGADFALFLN